MSDDGCPATNNRGEPCGLAAGWGTDNEAGPCKFHGGAAENQGAPEGNQNAVTHALYSDSNAYYQDLPDSEQAIIDDVFEAYYERYTDRHGEPVAGHELKLFKIAVNHHKELRADNWHSIRPDELDSGHPLVDREQKRDPQGNPYFEYTESAVLQAETRISRKTRNWLTDLGLMQDPDSEQAAATQDVASAIRELNEQADAAENS